MPAKLVQPPASPVPLHCALTRADRWLPTWDSNRTGRTLLAGSGKRPRKGELGRSDGVDRDRFVPPNLPIAGHCHTSGALMRRLWRPGRAAASHCRWSGGCQPNSSCSNEARESVNLPGLSETACSTTGDRRVDHCARFFITSTCKPTCSWVF